jgi:hypothetical protein
MANTGPIKLFTIGDSISQGFMSMAAARTDLSYSSIVAREMGWISDHPFWDKGGHPLNLELVFRKLSKRIGTEWETWNPVEFMKIMDSVTDLLDDVETFYERGDGRYDADYTPDRIGDPDYFHNVAVRGFNVSDAWTVSQDLCKNMIGKDKGSAVDNKNSGPSASFFRTAARVLSRKPVTNPKYNTYTAIDWLEHHTKENGGVENVFLWLGANNALATVLEMKISQTPGNLEPLPKLTQNATEAERKNLYTLYENQYNKYNLWHVDDFRKDYIQLLDHVNNALEAAPAGQATKIFIGTVPYVTIAPIARGMGKEFIIDGKRYFEYYTYFPFDNENLLEHPSLPTLRLSEVLFIEETIRTYNETIKELVNLYNDKFDKKHAGNKRFFIVDIATAFEQLAFRRNQGVPKYPLPDFINKRYPRPDTRYYERYPIRGAKGGLFSLDGVHPTAIGQGILAYEFMKSMHGAVVPNIKTKEVNTNGGIITEIQLDWEKIYADDLLYSYPIPLVSELFNHDRLKKFVIEFAQYFKG